MLMFLEPKVTFVVIRLRQSERNLTDYKQLSGDCHFLYCELLKDQAIDSISATRNQWRSNNLSFSSQSESVSIHISELPPQLSEELVSVVSNGTYAIMYFSSISHSL
jgi:hypothetical protein